MDQDMEIRIHRIVGGWALTNRVLMRPEALADIEAALAALVRDVARQERARCLAAIDGLYHGDACRAALRALE